jgi:uncharacterized integral membrane protein
VPPLNAHGRLGRIPGASLMAAPVGQVAEQYAADIAEHVVCAGPQTRREGGIMAQQSVGDTTSVAAERPGLRLSGGAIASLSGVAALLIFMIQNTDDVTVQFLFWSFTWPLWVLILVAALVGALVWFGFGVLRRHRRRTARRDARRD